MRKSTGRAFLAVIVFGATASAHTGARHETPGRLLGVAVEVGGRPAHLYPARDGSGRHYLQAREGAQYVLRLSNRSGQRLGVVVAVDGLNAISGQRDRGKGRMYVLGPGERTTVRGWRASLDEVRRFTFVDEKVSYAARSGKANARMGWIELEVFRESRRWVRRREPVDRVSPPGAPYGDSEDKARTLPLPAVQPPDATGTMDQSAPRSQAESRARSYPGTGWGSSAHDPVVLVDFEPETFAAQSTTLRYEYRDALVALGVLPPPHAPRERLAERDRGAGGFAPPPTW